MLYKFLYRNFFIEIYKKKKKKQNYSLGFPGGSDGKESAYSGGDPDLISGSGSSPLEKVMATHSSILA